MPMKDMFAELNNVPNELNNAPNFSSQQSYVRQGQPKMGADAMYQQMGQMPRGTGFAGQGGYQGQVYNTPQQPQPMAQPRPMQPSMPRPMQPQQLSPEQIQDFRQLLHKQRLEEMFNKNRMQGMLGDR
jgi:hypothetical protein